MNKLSADGRALFNSGNHTYTLDGKTNLTSVTTFISRFKNKFDSDYHANRIAIREGKTKEIVLKEWKDKADLSCSVGTYIHSIVENYILTGEIKTNSSIATPKELIIIKFINDYFVTGRLIPVLTEHIAYNNLIAGQIDLICKNKVGDFFILDFKTNKSIDEYSYGKLMLPPFNYLNDANFYHYSLQLSIYRELLLQMKTHRISDCFLVHIQDDGYKFIKCDNIEVSKAIDNHIHLL